MPVASDSLHRDRRAIWLWLIVAVLSVAAAVVIYRVVEPAPPRSVTIATGPAGGAYRAAAEQYAKVFGRNGVDLELLETAGSVENYDKLLNGEVEFAIVQGGTLPQDAGLRLRANEELQSVAGLYLEPLFAFYREAAFDAPPEDLRDLEGHPVAVGAAGSGTRRLVDELLAKFEFAGPLDLRELGGEQAVAALEQGEVDLALIVAGPDAENVQRLLSADGIGLASLRRAEAISRQLPYLRAVVLPEGAGNLSTNKPPEDVQLVAPSAVLITRNGTHSAAVLLAAVAAQETHRGGTLLSPPGAFPDVNATELPQNDTAAYHFKNGPSFLRRALPFWLASFAERGIIVLVPLLTLLIPLVRLTPPIYRWRVRSRIYKWYGTLREIDAVVTGPGASREQLVQQRDRLDGLEREALNTTVPLSYMQEFYNLRLHIGYLRRQLRAAGVEDVSVQDVA